MKRTKAVCWEEGGPEYQSDSSGSKPKTAPPDSQMIWRLIKHL